MKGLYSLLLIEFKRQTLYWLLLNCHQTFDSKAFIIVCTLGGEYYRVTKIHVTLLMEENVIMKCQILWLLRQLVL